MQDMLVRLYDLPDYQSDEKTLQSQGIHIRPALAPEKRLVCDWVQAHFSELWASECEIAFARQPVSCLIAHEGNEILGFACYETTCRNFFGPTGVAEAHRGRGLGKVLLWRALRAMWDMGYAYAIIGGVGPAEYYTKLVGASLISDSDPGIYKGLLKR